MLLALACASLVMGFTTPGPRVAPLPRSLAFGGRIIPADGAPLAGVRVVATDARGSYEALVDPSGVFVGAFPAEPIGPVTLRIFSDSSDARYHASTVRLGAGTADTPTRVVLIPRRWTIRGGPFDGRVVMVDPALATERSGGVAGFWRVTRRAHPTGRAVGWVVDSLPIRVAFRHERRDPAISSTDSSRFWAMASELELLLGRPLFRPASFSEIEGGADGILVTVDPGMPAAGRTFVTYDAAGRIYEALLTVSRRDYLDDPRVLMHELLHALGFGHTTGWRSVMGPSTGGVRAPTPEDVAYAQLYFAIAAIQRDREVPFGILEALSVAQREVVSR
jgi:hypothetical protein